MEDTNLNPEESVTSEQGVSSEEGESNESVSEPSTSLKELVKEATGREYKSDEEALKAIKNTFDYVGKAGKTAKVETPVQGDFVSKEQYEQDMFFSKKPNYEPFKDVLTAMSKASGKSLSEVVESDSFKSIYTKVKGYEEVENSKSVLESNPRLGKVTDKISDAHKALESGNSNLAAQKATEAVLEAFDLK